MKIFCIGWNYRAHNSEMSRAEQPEKPVVFLKPDSALLKNNKPFFIPDFSQQIEYEAELVFKIDKLGKNISEKFAHRYYSQAALGIDFTARDLQQQLRAKGEPWEISKGFDGSAVLSEFIDLENFINKNEINFSLKKNNEIVQIGNSKNMIFSIDKIIAYISQFYILRTGDLIYTGTPSGVGKVEIGDRLSGFIEGKEMLNFKIC
ncbi:MAG: fumarylacetoacetate hydrolase family protein [Prevotellaceae bacterium]|jgi:2-keto-4-pentenoate hydratase/2-oxohepta-3-ene-1,7-dioic acid hydratase in catechol pathway|nr:fumarylacetoacetate hydrolase family protein [Prevotellaceae bacterium]